MENFAPNTLIAGILILFVLLGLLKALIRFFLNLIALGFGAVAGIWGYNHGFLISQMIVAQPAAWMPGAVGILAFIIGVMIFRKLLSWLSGKNDAEKNSARKGIGLKGAFLGLFLGALISSLLLNGIRFAGTIAELKYLHESLEGSLEQMGKQPVLLQLKNWISQSDLGRWYEQVDFINDPESENLAKLIIVQKSGESLGISEQGSPTEEILKDLVQDESLNSSIERGDYSSLLRNKELQESARKNKGLLQLSLDKIIGTH